jgi:hypothetical protein
MMNRSAATARKAGTALLHNASWTPALQGLALSLALASLLAGCATRTIHHPEAREQIFQVPAFSMPIAEWQQRLGDYVTRIGGGDPAVLSQLPVLRSPITMRPARIVFAATDVDAVVAERDGYDVFGLLVDKRPDPSGPRYIFIVGTIERHDYRPAAVSDVRVAAMSVRGGSVVWDTGPDHPQALARYRQHANASSPLRFPADHDEFRTVPCDVRTCVEESGSGARWSIDLEARPSSAQATVE